MSVMPNAGDGKVTVPDLLQRKSQFPDAPSNSNSKKIVCLTAYDYPTARLLDEAGVDVLLIGDSLGMVVMGYDSTLPVTVDEMLLHTRAVRRGTRRALVVADMPYGSYHSDLGDSVRNAVRFVKEGGAEAVKIEGGERRLELISRLTEAEIPVMGHVGLTPQSVNALGGYRVQGKTADAGEQLLRDARAVEAATRIGGANYQRIADSYDWDRRGTRLRRADSGDQRSDRADVYAHAQVCAAVR
jgi:3-methyl-2-oxobutanoate hydroxymethyltransferase